MVDFRDRTSRILNLSKRNFGEGKDGCTLYPSSGGSIKFNGIFDNESQSVDPDTEQLISATQPSLGVNLFDFATEPKEDDQIQIRNLRYRIVEVRPDGQGGATLLLHRLNHEQKVFKKRIS